MRARFQRGVWTLHSFRLLISASMISIFGSLITSTAFPFIAIQRYNRCRIQTLVERRSR